jgi:hypothetical protein
MIRPGLNVFARAALCGVAAVIAFLVTVGVPAAAYWSGPAGILTAML